MPHLGDIPEEAEAREFGVDNAIDDATCCVPGRGATGSAAMTAGKFCRNVVRKSKVQKMNMKMEIRKRKMGMIHFARIRRNF